MRLLLDQNLSRRMLKELAPAFPGSSQMQLLGLEFADDRTLGQYAMDHGFALVTLDSDFHELATLYGAPIARAGMLPASCSNTASASKLSVTIWTRPCSKSIE